MTPSDPNDLAKRLARMASTTETSGPVHVTEDEGTGHQFLIYSTDSGLRIQLRFDGDGLWMSQGQIAELFGVNVRTVNEHIQNIYSEGELEEHPTIRKFRMVAGLKNASSNQFCDVTKLIERN